MTLAPDCGLLAEYSWDHTVASPARIRDAALGGKDNYSAERLALRELEDAAPGFTDLLRTVRAWHVRVVRLLAARGFDQFLDCAAGLPTARENTHQTAQRQNREAKVVYTDTDRLVVTYGRALLDDNDNTDVVHADHLDPHRLLTHEAVRSALDLSRPVALLMTAGVHHEPHDEHLATALAGYRELLPPGSALALSCWSHPDTPGGHRALARKIEHTWESLCHRPIRVRTDTDVRRFFTGLDLLEPGVARLDEWWPDGPVLRKPLPAQHLAFGGVGVKRGQDLR